MTGAAPAYDDPSAVAAEVASLTRPLLAAFDVDGVLAPIVAHAADAALLPGLLDALGALSARTPVGIVSGRNVENLARFGFPDSLPRRREPRRGATRASTRSAVGRRGRPARPAPCVRRSGRA